jgi:DNA-binding winged helix-turn-helix (wHTH) protein
MTLRFGDCEINLERRELWRAKRAVHVEPQVFDLLVNLVQNRDRVVTKDDLIASIWSGRIVSESTLTSRINAVRKAVGDSGLSQKLVRTIPRKGLRFIGLVHTQSDNGQLAQAADHPSDRVHGPSRPVLPAARPGRHCGASLLEHEPRSGTGVFFRRDQRRYHHGAVKAALILRDRAQLLIHLQGQGRAHEASRR